jgi:glycine/D-amino acid oxidase-like deaminating enzyme
VEVLDKRRTSELTGTTAYAGALLDRRAGTIQPLAYARGLAAAAMRAGAGVFTQTPVTHASRSGATWKLATGTGAFVEADWVIVATDVYARSDGVWPGVEREQVRLPYFNIATAPLPPHIAREILPARHGAWDTRRVLSSFRVDAAHRLVFGSVGALSGAGRAIHGDWARRAIAKLFPQLRDIPFEHAWYGTIGMTADALPRFHELDRNVVSFSGFNGRGIAPGTVLGRELARFVLNLTGVQALPLPGTRVAAVPWRRMRALGYEAGARALHLASRC